MSDLNQPPECLDLLVAKVDLHWQQPWHRAPAPHLLRGAIASAFPDNPLFHQHQGDILIYRYPKIHFRWEHEAGVILGFGEGAKPLMELFSGELPEMTLGKYRVNVREANVSLSQQQIKMSPQLKRYHFHTPWLALNQENHETYKSLGPQSRDGLLDRMIVGNLLSATKGLGFRLPERLQAVFQKKRSLSCRYKQTSLTGFEGTLICNLELPADFAIGKAVSHGYGWLKPVGTACPKEVS